MVYRFARLTVWWLLFFCSWAAAAPLLVLDAGHTPKQGGALSATGQYEVAYNDRFVAELQPALEQAGWRVMLTRRAGEEIGLRQRAAIANQAGAAVFLSIHHDSAQLQYLQAVTHQGQAAYQTIRPIRGYSLFVSADNPAFAQSRQLAVWLGQALRQLGRAPTLHHAEPIAGENRLLLDPAHGVYRYDQLAVLRQTHMPAVLLELGVIVDVHDEAYVSKAANRQAMIQAIVRALHHYRLHQHGGD